jgi:NADH-quinone oxidoreductase subunit F
VFVGGTSVPILTAEAFLDANLDYESMMEHNGALGSGAVILMDETTDMVKMCHSLTRFYMHESCGHCVPCRVGTSCAHDMMKQLLAHKGQPRDLATLDHLMDVMPITAHCGLGQTAPLPIASTMKFFRDEFEAYVKGN